MIIELVQIYPTRKTATIMTGFGHHTIFIKVLLVKIKDYYKKKNI